MHRMFSHGIPSEYSAPKALLFIPSEVLWPALTATPLCVSLLIAIYALRRKLVAKNLSTRVSFRLLPSPFFEPSAEEVGRVAHQLTRARPAAWSLHPRAGTSVRVRLATGEDGRLVYSWSGPRSAESILGSPAYPHVETEREKAPGEE
ncbi:hypothetical protein GCM10009602_08710 [Nocardiopsis tropica]